MKFKKEKFKKPRNTLFDTMVPDFDEEEEFPEEEDEEEPEEEEPDEEEGEEDEY